MVDAADHSDGFQETKYYLIFLHSIPERPLTREVVNLHRGLLPSSLDDARLAQFTRDSSFKTVVGEVKFGNGGGWSEARVLEVQYQNIKGTDLSDFKDARTQAVVWPASLASGALIYPYAKAKRNV